MFIRYCFFIQHSFSSPFTYGGSAENLNHPLHTAATSSIPVPLCPFPPSPTAPQDLTYSMPVSLIPPVKRSKAKKSRQGSIFQRIANKFSSSSKEQQQSMGKRRLSCPDLLDEEQPIVMVTPCDTAESVNKTRNISNTPNYPSEDSYHMEHSPSYRTGSYSQHRPTQLQITPTFGQPAVVRRRQTSPGSRDRVKSWAFSYSDSPQGGLPAPSNEVIPEESRSQVCLWNVPNCSVSGS